MDGVGSSVRKFKGIFELSFKQGPGSEISGEVAKMVWQKVVAQVRVCPLVM